MARRFACARPIALRYASAYGVILALASTDAGVARADPLPTGPGYEPWTDADPAAPPQRYALGDFGFRAGAEYRAQVIAVVPIAINSSHDANASWIEHRLRLDATVDYKDKIRIVTSTDAMDGVLWGDNGTFTGDPSSTAGTNVAARNPNETTPCIALRSGDPLLASSYGYLPCSQPPFNFRKAYGEVLLPFGLLRVGRQPVSPGTGVQAADGDGRPNRFGVSGPGGIVDRVLFATKPLEALKPDKERDLSEDGLVAAIAYDRLVTDSPSDPAQALNQIDGALRYRAPKLGPMRDVFANLYYVHRWDAQYSTAVNGVGARSAMRIGDLRAGFDVALNVGSTREVAEAYKVISNDPIVDQRILQGGGRVTVRYDRPLWGVYVEADYASGDSDPQVKTPLTQFIWSYDNNVGLLLFKRVLAYETARSSAAAVELLKRLGATTFPAEEIDTHGAFTDALAVFPQVDFHPHRDVLLRGGVLVAWAASKLIDPIASLKARDGTTIQDDLVNYVGGKPGNFYGVELDGRFQWRFLDHFLFDLEGAILFPGDALRDVDGYAVRSGLVQARTTFVL